MSQLGYPTSPEDMQACLATLLPHPDYATFVAEHNHRLAGMVGALIGHYYEKDGMYRRIVALVNSGHDIWRHIRSRVLCTPFLASCYNAARRELRHTASPQLSVFSTQQGGDR